jgi:hypothetical protein
MSELGEALKTIFGKISAFFDLFDLSFFVSGAVSLSALIFWLHLADRKLLFELQGWLRVLAIILGCYVNGLFCFAAGRWVHWIRRTKTIKDSNVHFEEILKAHGLDDEKPFKDYLDRKDVDGIRRLYIRLWAEVRQMDQLSPSLSLLNRYWVMAATYDGLAIALLVWLVVFIFWLTGFGVASPLNPFIGIPIIVALAGMAFRCFMESGRLVSNQREELVATIAVQRSRAES